MGLGTTMTNPTMDALLIPLGSGSVSVLGVNGHMSDCCARKIGPDLHW